MIFDTTSTITITGNTIFDDRINTLPRQLTILNQSWTVEYKDPVDAEDTNLLGLCIAHQRLIIINSNQSYESMLETLVHEIGHAYFSLIPHPIKHKWDEAFSRMFALAVIDLLRGNKQFSLY